MPQNVFPGPDDEGRPTWSAYGRDVPTGWEVRTNDDSTWRIMELNPNTYYQCRPRMAADPILPVAEDGSIVTTVAELLKRIDHEDWLFMTQEGRWLPLNSFPFQTFNLPHWPLRVRRIK